MKRWTEACVAQTGSQNSFRTPDGQEYFWELSSKEHDDGAITGTIQRVVKRDGDSSWCVPSDRFRIEGDGRVTRAPKFLKEAT